MTVEGSKSGRRHALARGAGGLAVIVGVVLGLWMWKERQATASVPPVTATDSLQVAAVDSVGADSTHASSRRGGLLGLFARKSHSKEKKTDPVPVELVAVEARDVPSFFVGTATIEADQQADILSKVAGTVLRLHVEEGDDVRQGDVLLEIDAAEPAARLRETSVRLESLERELERVAALHEKGLASDREFDDQKLLVEQARAQLQVGQVSVDWATVRAPFAGRITARSVDVGQTVTVGTPLVSMADLDPLLARVYMPEKQVERVAVGQEVQIIPEAQSSEAYTGRVDLIAPVVDPRSGTVKVTVALAGRADQLRPGAFVRTLIKTDVHADALVIPKQALVNEGGDSFVFRCVADSVVKVRVETGYSDDRYAEVVSGLALNDRVVTVGQGGLRHGTHVRELPAAIADAVPADSTGVVRR